MSILEELLTSVLEERKQHVRKNHPGNNKSLWDVVKIAKDIEPTPLPTTVTKEGVNYSRKEALAGFSRFFLIQDS